MSEPTLLVATSDTHAGAKTAAMRKPLILEDGVEVHPGPLNLDMANKIERAVDWVLAEARRWGSAGADRHGSVAIELLHNGDLTEGIHHGTHEIFVPELKGPQIEVAKDLLSIYTDALRPSRIYFTKGTEAHVGKGAELEIAVAASMLSDGLPVQRAPVTGQLVPQYWDVEIGGHQIWAAHHGKTGRLPHTKGSQASLHASAIFLQESMDNFWRMKSGQEPHPIPRIVIGSHHHQQSDSGPNTPTRAIQLPCWTYRNAFAHKVAAFGREDIGLAAIYCDPDRRDPEVSWWLHTPRRDAA